MLRVLVLIALASVVWVPIGVWVGLRPRVDAIVQPIAQFLAAFPANLLFPLVVYGIVSWKLNPDMWLSPLMILGHAVVHPVQRDRRRRRDARRNCATWRRTSASSGWLWWRRSRAARRASLLRHRRDHRLRRRLERARRRRGASAGAIAQSRRTASAPTSPMRPAPGTFTGVVLGIVTMSLFVVRSIACSGVPCTITPSVNSA